MELATWRPQLQDILARDVDRDAALATIPAIQAIWPVIQQAGDAADVCKAALVYSLYETTVKDEDGIPRAKWELVRLARNPWFDPGRDDPDEELMPCSATWQEFCLVHLGMHKSTASKYKRVWQVYRERLGYDLDDQLRAGVFKLGAAVSMVDRMIKDGAVDQRLLTALFGSEHTCSLCDEYVPFPKGEPLAVCPHCGGAYQGVQPWSGARTLLLLQQLRGKKEEEAASLDVFASLEKAYDDDGEVVTVSLLAECGLEGDEKSSLPSWEINIIDDDAPSGTLGVREGHLGMLLGWFGRKFPGV